MMVFLLPYGWCILKRILALLLLTLMLSAMAYAEKRSAFEVNGLWDSETNYDRGELTVQYLRSEKARREDEYANNYKRRNYLKDRLVFQFGFGSKFGFQADPASQVRLGVGTGLAVEYITQSGLAFFGSYGGIAETKDETASLEDGVDVYRPGLTAARVGFGYHFFSKVPLHPGIMLSYGHTIVGHENIPNLVAVDRKESALVVNKGFNVDATLTYLDYGWYYLTINVGMAITLENNSKNENGEPIVIESTTEMLEDRNFVFGFGAGVALADLMPDVTEKRRREREAVRSKFD